ncbi:GTP-binding protein YPT1 [Acrasis kona]|uniref:GTP-binding protein YPT1 n=1 Tax=Acrasis kona TaxID=1008807 RepID=A0AAW2YX56_9EUKA
MIRQAKVNKGLFSCVALCCCQGQQPLVDWVSNNVRSRLFIVMVMVSFVFNIASHFFMISDYTVVIGDIGAFVIFLIFPFIIFINNPRSNLLSIISCVSLLLLLLGAESYFMHRHILNLKDNVDIWNTLVRNVTTTGNVTATQPPQPVMLNFEPVSVQRFFQNAPNGELPPAFQKTIISIMNLLSLVVILFANSNQVGQQYTGIFQSFTSILMGLSALALVVLIIFMWGKKQHYRTKRQSYYQHVQGLFLVSRILKQDKIDKFKTSQDDVYLVDTVETSTDGDISDTEDDDISEYEREDTLPTNLIEEATTKRAIINTFRVIKEQIIFKLSMAKLKLIRYFTTKVEHWKHGDPTQNRYTAFYYGQRFSIANIAGLTISTWLISAAILIGAVHILPLIRVVKFMLYQLISCDIPDTFCDSGNKNIMEAILMVAEYVAPIVSTLVLLIPIFTLFVILVNSINMKSEYKSILLKMRRGRYFVNPKEYNITLAFQYIGNQMSRYTIHTILLLFVLVVVLFVCCVIGLAGTILFFAQRDYFNILMMFILEKLLTLLIPPIVVAITSTVTWFFIGLVFSTRGGKWLRFYTLLSYTEPMNFVVFYFVGIISALISWLKTGVVHILLRFVRIDRVLRSHDLHNNSSYASYVSAVLMEHRHNNPVLSVFADVIKRSDYSRSQQSTIITEEKTRYYGSADLNQPLNAQIDSTINRSDAKSKRTARLVKYIALLQTLKANPRLLDKRCKG